MQVSSAIPAQSSGSPNSSEIVPENLRGTSKGAGNSKKGKPGLFAALLDGLTGKSRKVAGKEPPKKQVDRVPETEAYVFVAAGNLFPGKKEALASLGNHSVTENLKVNPGKNEISVLSGTGQNQTAPIPQNTSEVETLQALSPGEEASPKGESPALLKELPGPKDLGFPGEDLAFNEEKKSPAFPKEGGKTAAVDVFPARNLEDRARQFTGEPKPALVDNLALSVREGAGVSGPRRGKGEKTAPEVRAGENQRGNTPETVNSSNFTLGPSERVDAEIPVELSITGSREIVGKAVSEAPQSSPFETALARELRDNLGADIVRQASIIVRDGGAGTIRLSLRPESLGNVKIRLEMTENKITGHIIVESGEALRAFERELPVLEKAFQDSGFSETSLDMFMAQDNGSRDSNRRGDEDFSPFPPELAVSRYESESDRNVMVSGAVSPDAAGRSAVNMLI